MRLVVLVCMLCACADDPLVPPTGEQVKYAVSRLMLPTTNTSAREFGLDLNGDKNVDNQLGMVMSTLFHEGVPPALHAEDQIARGELLVLANVQYARPTDPDDTVALALFEGINPSPTPCTDDLDTTCRRHLQGDGQFTALPSRHESLFAERKPRTIVGPGALTVSLPFYDDVVSLELAGARVRIDHADDTMFIGAIAGGLSIAQVHGALVPPLQRHLEQRIAAECSTRSDPFDCGCVGIDDDKTDAKTWLGLFDTSPRDCAISNEEIIHQSLVASLLWPDVEIDGVRMLSIGFGFEAVRATF